MNLIEGVCEKAIYHNGSVNGEVSDNVFVNAGGDQMYVGWGSGNQYLRNWGSRLNYPSSENGRSATLTTTATSSRPTARPSICPTTR